MAEKSYKSLQPKKSLGQNFLTDPWWIQRIVGAFGLGSDERVLEIGPGKGVLTEPLLSHAGEVIAVEIDSRMVEHLQTRFAGVDHLKIIHEDFLRYDLAAELGPGPLRIVGNLPYHVTSGIIGAVLDVIRHGMADPGRGPRVTGFDIMIQKEVGHRICSPHGNKVYGVLSVLANVLCDVRIALEVPPKAFTPQPKVQSSILHFRPLPGPRYKLSDWDLFRAIVRCAFNQRRKMLRNSLQGASSPLQSEELELLDSVLLERRPESLSPREFVEVCNTIHGARHE